MGLFTDRFMNIRAKRAALTHIIQCLLALLTMFAVSRAMIPIIVLIEIAFVNRRTRFAMADVGRSLRCVLGPCAIA
jgi:hypothetical protein